MTHAKLRKIIRTFWESKQHKEIPSIPLVPRDDPTTLFTSSGMQQLVPYLLGKEHPLGTRIYNIQRCFRAQDIEEVGDNRHTTSFEMIGNWSLGDYFKKEQLAWCFELFVNYMNLDPKKLFVTVFKGEGSIPRDDESIAIWKTVYKTYGIDAQIKTHIFPYGSDKNWWSRAGSPETMPAGEPGGPDSEIFFQFDISHDPKYGRFCHPNCQCGKFMEIGNSVFMEFQKQKDGSFSPLPKKNVDFGGGLERTLAAIANNPDIFATNLYAHSIETIEKVSGALYTRPETQSAIRVISDHMKASVFLIMDGVIPSNKEQGYVLRRLLRRSAVKMRALQGKLPLPSVFKTIAESILTTYEGVYFNVIKDSAIVNPIIEDEIARFGKSIEKGLKEIQKLENVDGKVAFDLYQTFGFPLEITEELLSEKGMHINRSQFRREFEKHQTLSRASASFKFKGGLADTGEQSVKYHTATHLIHQALYDVFGQAVTQQGSNITGERLRFDFSSSRKPMQEEINKVQDIVNKLIKNNLMVWEKNMPKDQAIAIGAKAFFREKYPDTVKVYSIGADEQTVYSRELCGGPHVKNTGEIKQITIYKFEKIGSNLYRIYAK